jgi:hypothetical protein
VYGLEAINEANGWYMAALGIMVVFLSLIILSIIISQLHKALDLWEEQKMAMSKKSSPPIISKTPENDSLCTKPPFQTTHSCLADISEIVEIWTPLIQKLDEPFRLADLYKLAAENDFPHPHLTINRLRRENILIPLEDHKFTFIYDKVD